MALTNNSEDKEVESSSRIEIAIVVPHFEVLQYSVNTEQTSVFGNVSHFLVLTHQSKHVGATS